MAAHVCIGTHVSARIISPNYALFFIARGEITHLLNGVCGVPLCSRCEGSCGPCCCDSKVLLLGFHITLSSLWLWREQLKWMHGRGHTTPDAVGELRHRNSHLHVDKQGPHAFYN